MPTTMTPQQLRDLGDLLQKIADAEVSAIMLDLACQDQLAKALRQVQNQAVRPLWDQGLLLGAELGGLEGKVLGVVKEIAKDPYGSGDFYAHYERPDGSRDCVCMIDIDPSDPTSMCWRRPGSKATGPWALAELLQWHGKTQEKLAPNEIALPA